MAASSNTDSFAIALHCEQCVTDCTDDGASLCPDCYGTLHLWVRAGPSAGTRLDAFCAEELGQSRIERPLALLADLAKKGERSSLHSTACAALAATALGFAHRWSASGELDLAFRISKGVSVILPSLPEAVDLAKMTCDSLVAELLLQARSSHEQRHWKKLTSLCNRVLEVVADNAEALELLGKARELHADNLVESAQQHLDAREYDAALRLAREALELVPESLAAQKLIRQTHEQRAADLFRQARECLGRSAMDQAHVLCQTLQTEYPTHSEACVQLRHEICLALIARSETAMSTDDWQNARVFAQKALNVEPGNTDAARLLADAEAKIHLKELAARALAAFRSKDLRNCRSACEAFLSYQAGCSAHLEFTDASGSVIDFSELPKKLSAEITEAARVRQIMAAIRIFKWAVGCVAILLVIAGLGCWRKSVFNKRVRAFDLAMQTQAYDSAKAVAPEIAGKYSPAADLLTYFKARTSFETALNDANTRLLQQYGATKWTDLQAQKQVADASAGLPGKGVEAYQQAAALFKECQTLAEIGEINRKESEAREKAVAEAKAKEKREQAEQKRIQAVRETEQLRARVRNDVKSVSANMNQNNPMGNAVEELGSAAVSSWKAASDNGWGEGQILLGLCYEFGIHVDKDSAKGRTLIRKAADQGIGLAEFCMALDIDSKRNPELEGEKIKWMLDAAAHGISRAQGTVAQWYFDGYHTVPKDIEKAVKWFRLGAESGDSWSQHQLAVCYYMGIQVNKDMDEAVKWIRLAADNGEVESQYTLGNMYFAGEGVPQNLAEAARCFRKAADQGFAKAQTTLGTMYLDGSGVPRDAGKALMWFRLAADQGWTDAQNNLGAMYAAGTGVPKSQTEAIKWYRLAARNGNKAAQANLQRGNISW